MPDKEDVQEKRDKSLPPALTETDGVDVRCPACKREIVTMHKIQDMENVTVFWYLCFCGTVFHTKGVDQTVFNEEYLNKWSTEMKSVEDRFEYLMRVYLPLIEDLTYGRKFLDVGFTLPFQMENLHNRGWITTGVELIDSPKIPKPYICGDFEKLDFKEDFKFDFILMGHVLESFADPRKALEKAYGMLNKYGILLITTPNPELIQITGLAGFGQWSWREKHIFLSKRKLKEIALRTGYNWVYARRNLAQRYSSWNDLHVLLQKGD